jgi:hypothetical protein
MSAKGDERVFHGHRRARRRLPSLGGSGVEKGTTENGRAGKVFGSIMRGSVVLDIQLVNVCSTSPTTVCISSLFESHLSAMTYYVLGGTLVGFTIEQFARRLASVKHCLSFRACKIATVAP